jgi:hypothetical protein
MAVSGQLHALGRFIPVAQCIWNWVGLSAGHHAMAKRKLFCPCRQSNHNSSVVQPMPRPTHDKTGYSRICKRSPISIWIYVSITSRKISEYVTLMQALTVTRTGLDTTGMVDFDTAWVIAMPTFATALFRVAPCDKLTSVPRTCPIKCQQGIHFFHWLNPSRSTTVLRSTQPLTEKSTRNISWVGWRRPMRRAGNLTTFVCRLSWNLGASTFWSHNGLPRPVMG